MPPDDTAHSLATIKAFKSNLILSARSFSGRGLLHLARPLYVTAAQYELKLAALFDGDGRPTDGDISRLSAASCLVQAGQFRSARPILAQLADEFPEAKDMLDECEARHDEPLSADPRALEALVLLLKKKGYINDADWQQALDEVLAGAGAGPRPPA